MYNIYTNKIFVYYIFSHIYSQRYIAAIPPSLFTAFIYNEITTWTHDYGNFTEARYYIKLYASFRDVIVRYAHRGM